MPHAPRGGSSRCLRPRGGGTRDSKSVERDDSGSEVRVVHGELPHVYAPHAVPDQEEGRADRHVDRFPCLINTRLEGVGFRVQGVGFMVRGKGSQVSD
jgi:hypothetical protein